MSSGPWDYVLVGGGLANGLLALALLDRGRRVALVEREERLGGNHTFCFHARDLPPHATWAAPLVQHRWDGYEVRFPRLARRVASAYRGFVGEHLDAVVQRRFAEASGAELHLGSTATAVDARGVTLADGQRIEGTAVIDARGPGRGPVADAGFQKFVGREVELERPHGLPRPVLMDATVPQVDGLRFFYVLPLSPTRLLVEDTRFSDGPVLDVHDLGAEVEAYLARNGWEVAALVREESGVLPMPWAPLPHPGRAPLLAGYAGGMLHPATGYSVPVAARLAVEVAKREPGALAGGALDPWIHELRQRQRLPLLLNRLLFQATPAASRVHVMERVHRRPDALLERLYALEATGRDAARLLVGRPPRGVPVGKAGLALVRSLRDGARP